MVTRTPVPALLPGIQYEPMLASKSPYQARRLRGGIPGSVAEPQEQKDTAAAKEFSVRCYNSETLCSFYLVDTSTTVIEVKGPKLSCNQEPLIVAHLVSTPIESY